ncbi:M20/M25/M40 family metallo-hydrolase [Lignipirellula cremea]|uniref:Peptidase T n=1 Tax=Lignipirellula cremea TaxID=2528010 RepID=A0A518DTF0_9BACT|nr:M20/M25/M40 family metallo-hydrolase [Lignipirellula cremea]QDU95121.1 Peptidase T [Lignipirellula cremea]
MTSLESTPEPDLSRAFDLVMEMMAIPGKSCEEGAIADWVEQRLLAAGALPEQIVRDTAHTRTPTPGQSGNLLLRLEGTVSGPRRLLSAHLDTVPICVGSQPLAEGEMVRSANPQTGLGADNRSGSAVILAAALEILERGLPHPPLTFCWFVQEEIGLQGVRCMDVPLLQGPRLAFNWDGGAAAKLTIGATGGYRILIEIEGLASHAGGAPERGVSAIAIAGLAIADLHRQGWHGLISKDGSLGTSNIGFIHGGEATNVVTDHVTLKAEARSHDPEFRQQIVDAIESAFRRAVEEVASDSGVKGSVRFEGRLDYDSFKLPATEPCVEAAVSVLRELGESPQLAIANGGLDANWLTKHGIPAVSLGSGQIGQHTVAEALDLEQFRLACRTALRLATGAGVWLLA